MAIRPATKTAATRPVTGDPAALEVILRMEPVLLEASVAAFLLRPVLLRALEEYLPRLVPLRDSAVSNRHLRERDTMDRVSKDRRTDSNRERRLAVTTTTRRLTNHRLTLTARLDLHLATAAAETAETLARTDSSKDRNLQVLTAVTMETQLRIAASNKDHPRQVPMAVTMETRAPMATSSKAQPLQVLTVVAMETLALMATSRTMETLALMDSSRVHLQLVLTVATEILLLMDSSKDLLAHMVNNKEAVLVVLMAAMEMVLHTVNNSKDSLRLALMATVATMETLVLMGSSKDPLHPLAMVSNKVHTLPLETRMQTTHPQPAM